MEMGCSFLNLFRGVEADGNFMRVILWVFFLVGIQAHVRNKVRLEIQLPAEAELTQAVQNARHIWSVKSGTYTHTRYERDLCPNPLKPMLRTDGQMLRPEDGSKFE